MRFLNRLGNKFFKLAVSVVIRNPLSDSLCGTKVFSDHMLIELLLGETN